MRHSFLGTIIATAILVIALFIVYAYYRSQLAKQALAKLNGETGKPMMGLSSFMIIILTVFVTVFVIIVSTDITMGAFRFSGSCSNSNPNSEPLAICYNGFGREIYADRNAAIKHYNLDNPSKEINFWTLLNYDDRNSLNEFENRIVNSMKFHNVVIQTHQNDFILENGLQIRVLSSSSFPYSTLNLEVSNLDVREIPLSHMYPIALFADNKIVVPTKIEDEVLVQGQGVGSDDILLPGETRLIKYYYPEILQPYLYYEMRIQGNNYTFERR